MVEAWPGYPDALAISNMLAEELGDETANARLLLLKPVRSFWPSTGVRKGPGDSIFLSPLKLFQSLLKGTPSGNIRGAFLHSVGNARQPFLSALVLALLCAVPCGH